jgi:hypothetical protein
MTAILAFFATNPKIIAIMGGIVAAIAWGFRQRLAGASAERAKQAASQSKAVSEAQAIDDAIAGRAPAANREELTKWSKS